MKRFSNIDPNITHKNLLDVLKWQRTSKKPKWPKSVPVGAFDVPPGKVAGDKIRISYVGHVTFLIQTESLNILTDPVWSSRVGPTSFLGFKRVTQPGIHFDQLPKIDIVVISHNHYDHMDVPTLKKLWKRDKPRIITPLKNDVILKSRISGIKVEPLNWSENLVVNNDVSIHLEPSQHWSARGLFDQNKALWGTFIIKTPNGAICFIGDSGYSSSLYKQIGQKYNDILVSLIPIGAYEPRWFMQNMHMNPEESVLVHQDLKSKHSIGSHFETFHLADDAFKQPAEELEQAKKKHHISEQSFITPKAGNVYWFDAIKR